MIWLRLIWWMTQRGATHGAGLGALLGVFAFVVGVVYGFVYGAIVGISTGMISGVALAILTWWRFLPPQNSLTFRLSAAALTIICTAVTSLLVMKLMDARVTWIALAVTVATIRAAFVAWRFPEYAASEFSAQIPSRKPPVNVLS